MDICMATDENYAFILKVVILSIVNNNQESEKIMFHILEDGVAEKTKKEIVSIVTKYRRSVKFYNISESIGGIKRSISNDWANANSYVAYARLYLPEILDDRIERILYLDCDTLVVATLQPLFELDMQSRCMAAVKDVLPYLYKKSKGLEDGEYYNSGILVIDCKRWRDNDLTNKLLEYCYKHANDAYPDQDALNILLHGQIFELSPSYCVFYPENGWSSKIQVKGHGSKEEYYYSVQELDDARNRPRIIHYVDTVLGRPWQANNINPYAVEWMKYYNMLSREERVNFKDKNVSKRQRIFRWMYRILPTEIFAKIYYYNRNNGILKKMKMIERHK